MESGCRLDNPYDLPSWPHARSEDVWSNVPARELFWLFRLDRGSAGGEGWVGMILRGVEGGVVVDRIVPG